jgi:hypothetical protein
VKLAEGSVGSGDSSCAVSSGRAIRPIVTVFVRPERAVVSVAAVSTPSPESPYTALPAYSSWTAADVVSDLAEVVVRFVIQIDQAAATTVAAVATIPAPAAIAAIPRVTAGIAIAAIATIPTCTAAATIPRTTTGAACSAGGIEYDPSVERIDGQQQRPAGFTVRASNSVLPILAPAAIGARLPFDIVEPTTISVFPVGTLATCPAILSGAAVGAGRSLKIPFRRHKILAFLDFFELAGECSREMRGFLNHFGAFVHVPVVGKQCDYRRANRESRVWTDDDVAERESGEIQVELAKPLGNEQLLEFHQPPKAMQSIPLRRWRQQRFAQCLLTSAHALFHPYDNGDRPFRRQRGHDCAEESRIQLTDALFLTCLEVDEAR